MIRAFSILVLTLLLSACAATPDQNRVEIAPERFITLPSPAEFGGQTSVNQLISARWGESTQVLPVHLEITPSEVVLVGFSSWGTRILSLKYDGETIETDHLTGLGSVLPDARQVLLNLMLTLWPASSWQPHLSPIGWQLGDSPRERVLLNDSGETVAKIQYDERPEAGTIPATIWFEHLQPPYQIQIQTLE